MRHVVRSGGSIRIRRSDRTRLVSLVATFLLLIAGVIVSAPGLMTASATSPTHAGSDNGDHGGKDDGTHNGDHGGTDNGDHSGDDNGDHNGQCENQDQGKNDDDGTDNGHDDGTDNGHDDGTDNGHDDGTDNGNDDGHHDGKDDGENDGIDDDAPCPTTANLTLNKIVINDNGGTAVIADFTLTATSLVGSVKVINGPDPLADPNVGITADVAAPATYVLSESGPTGYDASSWTCSAGSLAGNTLTLAPGDVASCTITNNDTPPVPPNTAALTLNKVVINDNAGTATIANFTLKATSSVGAIVVISGPDPSADPASGISANVPAPGSYVLSESGPTGYDASSWTCSAGILVGNTLTLAAGAVASCTITNNDTPPVPPNTATITVVKSVTNSFGGTLNAPDFQLKIDNANVVQGAPQTVAAGTHVISELARPGYSQTAITCTDAVTHAVVNDVAGSINVAAGQAVACTVFNADIAPTLTVIKHVNPDVVPTAAPGSFQLTIDGQNVSQNAPHNEQAGTHTVGEVAVAGYHLVAINCTLDGTTTVVDYTAGVTLALDQHVTCVVTNQHDPIDVSITKTVSATSKVAGGAPFDYTITVDNLGPRDATAADNVTVTDQLPAGLQFVSFPANCSSALQTLTCAIDAADLQVTDPPVMLTVTVKVNPDTTSGTYTNMAFVNTPSDPACVGGNCVPACDSPTNNVACASTTVVRQSSILVTKVANVVSPVHPGGSYAYSITVTNGGPSSFLPNTAVTDVLPADLVLESVDATNPWNCTTGSTIVCTYGAALAPSASAPVITVHVHVVTTSVLDTITNTAQAIAIVELGNVVTGTADAVTPIVRSADLSIDKSASTTPGVVGSTFDWLIDVVNHGPDTATNLVVKDPMPAQFRVESATSASAGVSCTNTTSSVQCTLATLANGASFRITVHVTVLGPAGPAITNTATVEASSADPIVPNNADTVTVGVVDQASSPPVPAAPAPVPPAPVREPQLPRTGNAPLGGPLGLGALLVGAGLLSMEVARRRRCTTG